MWVMEISAALMPVMIALITVYALIKGNSVFDSFTKGATEGLKNAVLIAPSIMGLVVGVTMLRHSGAIDYITNALRVVTDRFNVPGETLPLLLLRPVSGSGSLALLNDVLSRYGADSFVGRVASTVMGGTETTFYAIAVYLGAAGIRKGCSKIVVFALCADITCYALSIAIWNFFM